MAEETSMAHTSAKSNDEVLQKFILYFEENTKAKDYNYNYNIFHLEKYGFQTSLSRNSLKKQN